MTVASTVFEQLAAARRAGEAFGRAWPVARDAALALADEDNERDDWAEAFDATLSSWCAAFERRAPRRAELALAAVADDPDRSIPIPDRECARCGEQVPVERGSAALYCCRRCCQLASDDRRSWGVVPSAA